MPDGAVILFADLVDSSQHARYLQGEPFASLLREYQAVASDILLRRVGIVSEPARNVWSVSGDEASLILRGEPASQIGLALLIGLELKLRWYFGKFNLSRINERKDLIDVAVGVHYGVVDEGRDFAARYEPAERLIIAKSSGPRQTRSHQRFVRGRILPDISLVGFHIHLAKRVEGAARHTDTRIVASNTAWDLVIKNEMRWEGRDQPALQVKGSGDISVNVTELRGVRLSRSRYVDYLRGVVFYGHSNTLNQGGLRAFDIAHSIRPNDSLLAGILAQIYEDAGSPKDARRVRRQGTV
jgi:class 3 adenylate cyclase